MKIAVQGLGRMGMQIARKLAESGEHTVIAHNRHHEPIDEAATFGAVKAYEKADVIREFGDDQIVIWIMLPDAIVDAQVDEWIPLLRPGSIIIDGGNSDFRSTQHLSEKIKAAGMELLDIGVSGGVWGYQNGFPLMCGGDSKEAFAVLEPALKTLVQPGGMYYHFGPSGAGHFVKMVHNAIEYGMMESLGEGFRMLHDGPYAGQLNLAEAADLWQHHSVITSWLTELSRDALRENPELEGVSGYVAESGEARWTLDLAKEMGIALPSIQAAFDVRVASQSGDANFATKVVAAQRNKFGGHNLNGEGAEAGAREAVAHEQSGEPSGVNYERLNQPLVLAIFGITGDLAQRKLLPALYHLAKADELPEQFRIIGISRRDVSLDDVYKQLPEFVSGEAYDSIVERYLKEHTEMRQMDLLNAEDYKALLGRLQEVETELGPDGSRLYYLSIPSQAFSPIIRLLGETGHNAPLSGGGDAPRLLIEKPFGYDLASARELIAVLSEHFGEGQVYRIDHYVAKETVQNILTFRFYNPLFESIWNNKHIDHISVVAHEKIGIEDRANFYEQTGALRDFIQNHLLQLLAITTMSRPEKMESEAIHEQKQALLEAIRPIAPDEVATMALRGQYEGYRQEVNNPDSLIETFASLQLWIDSEDWTGVPITLETGKALSEKLTEVSICFRQPDDALTEENKLVFRIQPSEGITLRLQAKRPGIKNITDGVNMDFDYAQAFAERPAEAYERVIVDAIRGDQTLFATSAEVLRSWQIVENVLEQWSRSADGLSMYPKGSSGPNPSS